LNTGHPRVMQLLMESLRYWVTEMHVDGFRFDLAPALAREPQHFNRHSPFFHVLLQDPVLSQVKLIAEPWDPDEGGYQVGNFPWPWREWNDKYRDTIQRFWQGESGQMQDLGHRLTGSEGLYAKRGPLTSINYVTSHDELTLYDLVRVWLEHATTSPGDLPDSQEAPGAGDSTADHQGPNDDAGRLANDGALAAFYGKQQRNVLATLLLSQGVPMLCAGDERGRTQQGSKNTYNQDNERNWLDWELPPEKAALLDFTRAVVALVKDHPILRRQHFWHGQYLRGSFTKDLAWLRPDGLEMLQEDWEAPESRCVGILLAGEAFTPMPAGRERLPDDTLLIVLNAQPEAVPFVLPALQATGVWEVVLCTDGPLWHAPYPTYEHQECYTIPACSLSLLQYARELQAPPYEPHQ
jgi:isoamylase